MDHLLLLRHSDSQHPEDTVLNYCGEPPEIPEDFYGYPATQIGFGEFCRDEFGTSAGTTAVPPSQSCGRIEEFLQTWLFFGFLRTVLGSQFSSQDYLSDGSSHVVTKKLVARLQSQLNPSPSVHYIKHTSLLLQRMRLVLSMIQSSWSTLVVDRMLIFSIAATFECVHNAMVPHISGTSIANWGLPLIGDLLKERMLRNGWCASEVTRMFAQMLSCASRYNVSTLTRHKVAGESHNQCNDQRCSLANIDESTYETKHHKSCSGRKCYDVSASEPEMIRILSSGSYPVLSLFTLPTGKLRIRVHSWKPRLLYVAVSHVWADGLGNKQKNSLPVCQLRHLKTLLVSLTRSHSLEVNHSLPETKYFWIDTLCIPLHDRSAKNCALQRMRTIYAQATGVLIRDSTLDQIHLENAYLADDTEERALWMLECATRLAISPWMTRLWTLQEGALTANAIVQFGNCAIHLQCLTSACSSFWGDVRYHSLSSDLLGVLDVFERFYSSDDLEYENITTLSPELCHRLVSRPEDEALCIAYMLHIDAKSIVQKRHQGERMEELWRTLHRTNKIPTSIVFNRLPRLNHQGMRWAPSTLLVGMEWSASFLRETSIATSIALSDLGLGIHVPGYTLKQPLKFYQGAILFKDQSQLPYWFLPAEGSLERVVQIGTMDTEAVPSNSLCVLFHDQFPADIKTQSEYRWALLGRNRTIDVNSTKTIETISVGMLMRQPKGHHDVLPGSEFPSTLDEHPLDTLWYID